MNPISLSVPEWPFVRVYYLLNSRWHVLKAKNYEHAQLLSIELKNKGFKHYWREGTATYKYTEFVNVPVVKRIRLASMNELVAMPKGTVEMMPFRRATSDQSIDFGELESEALLKPFSAARSKLGILQPSKFMKDGRLFTLAELLEMHSELSKKSEE